ncbi:AAA family ATPase [Pedobacter kyonggii]|uniref:Protein CR006 P-loop domain-containing protein n=1 Tax=Pedobacter kyonggii TaxID=1926871 RepID=A0A4Q9HB00_9SPHI|nr:AAA family ATPase [Pedobacter kyonggii]TBO41193.1 hypothetical protein EYS08_15655 [Pedobacter kyonggii]
MIELPLRTKLIEWINTYPYWFRYACKIILEDRALDEEEVKKCYRYFLEDENLAKVLEHPRTEIVFESGGGQSGETDSSFELRAIKDIENVNALSKDQVIKINKHLTIIFGVNGAGKSGYSRLLNNSFGGRGEKKILANVFSPSTESPKCSFMFSNDGGEYQLDYPADKENEAFKRFMVYDSKCARVHLEQENGLLFTPAGFGFFNYVLDLFEVLKEVHSEKLAEMRPLNHFVNLFLNENAINEKIASLGADTKDEDIATLFIWTVDDKKRQDELTVRKGELISLDIPKKLLETQQSKQLLQNFKNDVESVLKEMSEIQVSEVNNTVDNIVKFAKLADAEGVDSLHSYGIEDLGSPAWKNFIASAQKYAVGLRLEVDNSSVYPDNNDNCLFCLQPLQVKQKELIEAYWSLLRSEASSEGNKARGILAEQIAAIKKVIVPIFNEESTVRALVLAKNPALAAECDIVMSSISTYRETLLGNMNGLVLTPSVKLLFPVEKIQALITIVEDSLEELMKKDTAAELLAIDNEIKLLNDKLLVGQQKEEILKFLKSHRWAKKAEKSLAQFKSNSITNKQGGLFAQHVTDKYLALFIDECRALDAPSRVTINQRNTKGQTLRKLKIEGELANNVLSEGEQRAISLADFLTEMQLDENNRGVIFDDPVTSLDHERKALIARRLAVESAKRQVIVFTHDIAFFVQLQNFAESLEGISCEYTTIRKIGDAAGLISPDLPWVAQKVKDRIKYLRNSLVKLKVMEKGGQQDDYAFAAKTWYGLLRESWERSVEERLFKGVIQRFSFGIETQKLKKVVINEELLKSIEEGMTEASKWVHDSSAELNPTTPKSDKLDADLKSFEDFAIACVAA